MEKHGTRSTRVGRCLGCLSILELGNQSREIQKKYRIEKAYHGHNRHRVAQLQIYKPLLQELKNSSDVQGDTLKFCTSILTADKIGAFGGKAALWDFMKDIANNLNRKKEGFHFSGNTRAFFQT